MVHNHQCPEQKSGVSHDSKNQMLMQKVEYAEMFFCFNYYFYLLRNLTFAQNNNRLDLLLIGLIVFVMKWQNKNMDFRLIFYENVHTNIYVRKHRNVNNKKVLHFEVNTCIYEFLMFTTIMLLPLVFHIWQHSFCTSKP